MRANTYGAASFGPNTCTVYSATGCNPVKMEATQTMFSNGRTFSRVSVSNTVANKMFGGNRRAVGKKGK